MSKEAMIKALGDLQAGYVGNAMQILREALAEQPAYRAVKTFHEGKPVYVAEQPAQQEPVLQDIEQYRLQMAGISTAAIGYWKEGDGIHPDYDTLALRDVAKLYEKYDELYKAQDVSHGIIAGALFDFMAWLTSRPKRIMLSSTDDASPAVDAIKDFAKIRGLSLDDARVQDWQEALAEQPAQQEPVAIHQFRSPHCSDWYDGVPDHHDGHGPYEVRTLYTSPPAQRTWVGLSDEEISARAANFYNPEMYKRAALWAQEKLKERNQ